MQPETQRRSTRVPLGVLVELTHEDFDEPFEADGIDVGVGGLGMRAAFLPDVGSRMRASFADPEGGRRVEAPCEVVWARDSGPHVGQVGLRFTSLAPGAQEAIQGMVSRATDGDAAEGPRGHVIEPEVQEVAGEDHTAVRLTIEGVEGSIPARVVARYEGGVRVVQRLGLFKLGTQVAVQNGARKHSRIEGVAIRTDGDVPELILDLALDAPDPRPPEESTHDGHDGLASGPAPEDPVVLDAQVEEPVDTEAPDTIPDTPSPAASVQAELDSLPAEGPAPMASRSPEAAPARQAEHAHVDPPAAPMGDDAVVTAPASMALRMRSAVEALVPHWRRLRAALAALVAGIGPWLARGRVGVRAVVARARPVVQHAWRRSATRVVHFVTVLRGRMGLKVPALSRRPQKRRTTAPPPARSNVAGSRRPASQAEDPRRERARTWMLAVVAFAGAAALVYALSPGASDEVDTHRPVEAPAPAAEAPADDPVEAASQERTTAAESAPEPAPQPQEPGTVPASSPYADPEPEAEEPDVAGAPELTSEFGDTSVPDGRSFLLRMSQPVESIRGTAERHGFTVIIPDSLSLDRAGPIAAAHPAVERSMVLNRGDHAELSIRFVEGESPPYKVRGRGRAVEITLGQ